MTRPTFTNAGKPWSPEDDAAIRAAFAADDASTRQQTIGALADQLGRTRFGIEQRSIKLGLLQPIRTPPGDTVRGH